MTWDSSQVIDLVISRRVERLNNAKSILLINHQLLVLWYLVEIVTHHKNHREGIGEVEHTEGSFWATDFSICYTCCINGNVYVFAS